VTNDRISALMDGELDETAAGAAIEAAQREGEAGEAWRTYHLIRDAMTDTRVLSEGFDARMAKRLAAEPTVLAPPARRRVVAKPEARRWMAFAPQPAVAPQQQVAVAPKAVEAPKEPARVALTPIPVSANDYLLAHQGFSPRVSLQGMAPYVRSVSSDR
jgi:sigma-E factor negative regulatory protein RseA